MKDIYKSPRLFAQQDLSPASPVALSEGQAHYLRSVLRLPVGSAVRIFNGRDGEWSAKIEELGKKSGGLELQEQTITQPAAPRPLRLLFSPIKKNRMDFLIEKAVELGVTDLYPVITTRTDARKINEERITAQIIEAAEQCERLDIPALHQTKPLKAMIQGWDDKAQIAWAAERIDAPHISTLNNAQSFLIGPEGGFSPEEIDSLQRASCIQPVSLGQRILRAETAALFCLSRAQ